MTEDEMVGWHHRLNGNQFKYLPGVGDGQGGLACCGSLHDKQMGKQWKQWLTLFWGAPKLLQMVIAAMKLKDAYSLEGKL